LLTRRVAARSASAAETMPCATKDAIRKMFAGSANAMQRTRGAECAEQLQQFARARFAA